MRFPPFSELDKDQRRLYSDAPSTGSLLITGPPGSGKTVVAMHRALKLGKDGAPVKVVMFNKVLARYTANFENLPSNIKITNLHPWVKGWHKKAFYRMPPMRDKFNFDWDKISSNILSCSDTNVLNNLHWGNLIIDEGQDFPVSMYKCLQRLVRHKGYPDGKGPTLTVFADENQTITENHSSISQVTEELGTSTRNNRLWRLDKNYRNCKEIAEFSRYYQLVGAGSARLPDHNSGVKPIIFVFEENNRDIDQIVNYTANNPGEIGVVVFGRKGDVKSTYNKIKHRVESKDMDCRVQAYASYFREPMGDVKNLHFDNPPSITVVHAQSAKGLEFDTVFIVNFPDLDAFDAGETDSYKKLYVISSRARSGLFAFLPGSTDGGLATTTRLLPRPREDLCQYLCVENWANQLNGLLEDIEWLDSASQQERLSIEQENLAEKLLALGLGTAKSILQEVADQTFDTQVLKTIIDDKINWKKKEDVVNVIVELGRNNVKRMMQSRENS
jgi:DNA helicase-2/ATP-dependent DNA helicase PcrA